MVRDSASRLLTMRVSYRASFSDLILRSSPQAGVSKDGRAKTHFRDLGTRKASEFFVSLSLNKEEEGAGNAGCLVHPQPRVRMQKAHEHSHHRYAETIRHSLREWF